MTKKSKKAPSTKTKQYWCISYNILVSKKESYGTKNSLKYFVGYNDNDVIRPLCIRLP